METESQKQKGNYYNLAYVIEFERIFNEFMNAIWKTSDAQGNFWMHLSNPNMIDFNALDKDNDNIYKFAKETGELWNDLCKINPNYSAAIFKYTNYLREMRNNDQLANDIQDKMKNDTTKKSLSALAKQNDVLFDEKTAILHVSGAKESLGKVIKVNQGTLQVLGYSPIELLQNSVNKIMPNVISRKHNDLMETHFKSGRNRIFNKERHLFAVHKDGYCFHMKLMVKPLPMLEDGFIQYVGMIIPTQEDYEFIITDMFGTIDSMSKNLASKLGISAKMMHSSAGINIQIIAPTLMYAYQEDGKKNGKAQKFKEPGGEELLLIVPNNFKKILNDGQKGKKSSPSMSLEQIVKLNRIFNRKKTGKRSSEITPMHFYQMEEYKKCLVKAKVKCEIQDLKFGLAKSESAVSIRVLKISGLRMKKDEKDNNLDLVENNEIEEKQEDNIGRNNSSKDLLDLNSPKEDKEENKKNEQDSPSRSRTKELLSRVLKDSRLVKEEDKSQDSSPKEEKNASSENESKEIKENSDIEVKKVEEKQEDSPEHKHEPSPEECDEEVVSVKPKPNAVQEMDLISPREPLESSRKLMETPRRNLSAIPETENENTPQTQLPSKPLKVPSVSEEKRDEENTNKKDSLFRNSTAFQSIAGDEENRTGQHKRTKIVDCYEPGNKILVQLDPYEEGEKEIALKKHFISIQMKERKAKEKIGGGAVQSSEEENTEEKKEEKPDEKAEEKAEEEVEEMDEDIDENKERDEDEEGSISSSSTGATIRSNYSIRAAIDEKYVPKSIKNMNYMTIFMFVLLLALAIAYYGSQISLYSSIQDNIKNIQYSEERKNSLIDINLNIKRLTMIAKDNLETNEAQSLLDMDSDNKTSLAIQSKANLTRSALSLKQAQTQLSLKTSNIGASQLAKINPDNVYMYYLPTTGEMPDYYMYTIWQAMLEVVVTSLKIANMTTNTINDDNPAVYVINKNSLNTVLVSLNHSTNELVDVIETSRKDNMTVYLILLIVASVAAAVSTLVLIPVISSAKKAKEKVLLLFFLLDDAEVKRYQFKCERFKRQYKTTVFFF